MNNNYQTTYYQQSVLQKQKLNKDLLIVNLVFSLSATICFIIVTIILNVNYQPMNFLLFRISNHNIYLPLFFVAGSFIFLGCFFLLVNFISAFFIDTKTNKLFWAIKITSWVPLFSTFNWIFNSWFLISYSKLTNDLQNNYSLKKQLIKELSISTLVFSISAIILITNGIIGQLTYDANGKINLFLPSAFFSLICYATSVFASISIYTLITLNHYHYSKLIFIFLLLCPWITPLYLLSKKSQPKKLIVNL